MSAQDGNGMNELLDELRKQAGEGGHFFDDDTLTDQPERVIVAEIIREKYSVFATGKFRTARLL